MNQTEKLSNVTPRKKRICYYSPELHVTIFHPATYRINLDRCDLATPLGFCPRTVSNKELSGASLCLAIPL